KPRQVRTVTATFVTQSPGVSGKRFVSRVSPLVSATLRHYLARDIPGLRTHIAAHEVRPQSPSRFAGTADIPPGRRVHRLPRCSPALMSTNDESDREVRCLPEMKSRALRHPPREQRLYAVWPSADFSWLRILSSVDRRNLERCVNLSCPREQSAFEVRNLI